MILRKATNDDLMRGLFNEGPRNSKGPGLGDCEDV